MNRILNKLNVEHYAGNATYSPVAEWETMHGEMGLYQANTDGIAGENLLLIILVDGKMNTRLYSACFPEQAIAEAQHIAKFAGATLVVK